MDAKTLNVVYIGSPAFPNGLATTKRRRYMVDYMNAHGIHSHVLVCHYKNNTPYHNPESGTYGLCTYRDITPLAIKKDFISFYREGKKMLKEWYMDGAQNALVFSTLLAPLHYPFYSYARKLGYIIVFDLVETSSFVTGGKMRKKRLVNEWISDRLTNLAMNHAACFVISTALQKQTEQRYPNTRTCLLPNATPSLKLEDKTSLHRPIRVLYAGTFAPKDGVDYLIDGAIEANGKGCDLELILMGKGQPWDMKVLDKLKDKRWAKYLGFVSDEELLNQIRNADVLCMTRDNSIFANYGFPFKLSEYLSTGNLLLATRVGDVERYVQDKKSAFIIDPENSKQISDALCYIQNNEMEALEIARNGYEAMQKHFSIEKVGHTFIEFLNSL